MIDDAMSFIEVILILHQQIKDMIKDIVSLFRNLWLRIAMKLQIEIYRDINHDIVSRFPLSELLMVILMVTLSMIKIESVLKMIQQMKLKCFYQDNNQDILSQLSETRASSQVFCPCFSNMGISCPHSIFVSHNASH